MKIEITEKIQDALDDIPSPCYPMVDGYTISH